MEISKLKTMNYCLQEKIAIEQKVELKDKINHISKRLSEAGMKSKIGMIVHDDITIEMHPLEVNDVLGLLRLYDLLPYIPKE